MVTRLLCAAVVLLAAAGGYATAQTLGPTIGACFATNGTDVQTTYLDGGALYYPAPNTAEITQHADGFTVVHTVRFRDVGHRVYMPMAVTQ